MRRLAPVLLLLLVAALATAAPVSAHPPAAPDTAGPVLEVVRATSVELIGAAPQAPGLDAIILALVAGAVVATVAPRRRALALTLVLVAGLLAFESGVHAAHHLGDETAGCAVAWVSAQLSGEVVEVATVPVPRALTDARLPAAVVTLVAARGLAADAGRAPPRLSA
ncbi:MAG TPA: hypothetical protein VEA38_23785 [Terriglobales bacterium]|nr:hypothetical protein [Terriglobales bacterium]